MAAYIPPGSSRAGWYLGAAVKLRAVTASTGELENGAEGSGLRDALDWRPADQIQQPWDPCRKPAVKVVAASHTLGCPRQDAADPAQSRQLSRHPAAAACNQ